MKIFQCSSPDPGTSELMRPSIPNVFPPCCPVSCCQCGMMPSCCFEGCTDPAAIFPLGDLPCDSTNGVSPFSQNTLTQNTAAVPSAAAVTPPEAVNSAAAARFAAAPAAPSSPVMGSAAQFSLRSSGAENAQLLSLVPDVVSGQDIRSYEKGLSFAPGSLYFLSLNLKAMAGAGHFCEVIAQLDGQLHPDLCAYAAVPQTEEEAPAGAAGLSANFLLDTVGFEEERLLELVFHTDAGRPIAITGNLLAFKLGEISQS